METAKFRALPILGILRGIDAEALEPLLSAIESSGLKTIEITMNTRGAPGLIRKAVELAGERLTIGAGTVLDMESLNSALDAGASFIVMPALIKNVTAYCVKNGIPVFPGALTPQEIYAAWRAGATMVKVFPSNFFGPEYFKEIRGPFNDVELLACGGVTPENMKSYFSNGASAVSFGAGVFKKEWLAKKDFQSIEQAIQKYIREFPAK
ncbi:MAG: bifunctional 4-hydroxy-2-oxoglutarate aldolase/2-dehydro-3-deoxy-phosphogluconate aldolase [Candidatus Omnitrophica bacterium]|nr:bifunctional 4-hydroxy-2-oxoglutarate aldolase/2-dehydro-3-deoxy-phosphogluconate aldolase [Candidatus Omnitrophota bacterium]MDD5654198.1 bifunctional 4-hydroxy-2-oxoglutarate aldolase/2-dehydro-3-deoxy-phosphogluconate aldolase [Candidatus Omnitrophota bacterium]